ncbi:MAG TPA: amino acid adenylation domain-containing protein [Bryobacteraceae bacterium]|jgi:amino acid adenylation domain-containing protein|nr:amino acid adenylation domain-containing protein [Bryobacteraceae bacterium]
MDDLKARVARLSPEKLNLLMQRLKREAPAAEAPVIGRRPDRASAPLSFSQQRVWFIDQLETGSYAHNLLTAIRIQGKLNIEALHATVQAIVARHEVLRATFQMVDGSPAQMIAEHLEVPIRVVDIGSSADPEEPMNALADQESLRPFDLSRGPMLRLTLLRVQEQRSVLLLAMHHIIGDGWSRTIFAREFAALYDDFCKGRKASLPPVPVQYPDYAAWQHASLDLSAPARQLEYWKGQFGRPVTPLDLPTDFARPAVQTFHGQRIRFQLAPGALERLQSLAKAESATPFMILLAAFQALLSRYCRQEDIVVGSAVANRSIVETEATIGFFANTITLRTDLSGNPTFQQLLQRVRGVALGAYANQQFPFERLVQELQPERDLSRTPLFQVMFLLDNTQAGKIRAGDIEADLLDFDARISPFDLTLTIEERRDGLHGNLEFNTDLFEQRTIEAMVAAFQTLLEHAVESPDTRIRELMLTSAHREDTRVAPVTDKPRTVLTLLEQSGKLHSQAPAIVDGNKTVSYAELTQRSNSIASALADLGVGAENVVAVWGERRFESIAAILGILRTGAAWLPLDPSLPLQRINTIVSDAGARFIAAVNGRTPLVEACTAVDTDATGAADQNGSAVEFGPDALAYVIYTSGSTGAPKGVEITHSALACYTAAAREAYRLKPTDRVLQFASLGFDASIEEIFPTLAAGAALVIGSDKTLGATADFVEFSRQQGITVWTLPSAFWSQMVNEIAVSRVELPPALRLCIIGGERADPHAWALWEKIAPQAALVNTYGPTEATVIATLHKGGQDASSERARREVPIGRALPGCDALILDDALYPVPIGVPGELFLSGLNLARGYRNRPRLTAQAFLPHPRPSRPGERLYRTGDLARLRGDGELEHWGRADSQVKVRGYRVEPGEIEFILKQHSGVRDCAVALTGEGAVAQLIAAVVPTERVQFDAEDAKTYLRTRLPAFMVPSAIVTVERIPLNANGKVNRAALVTLIPPAIGPATPVMPRSDVEVGMAAIWSRLLAIPSPTLTHNFFESGGHSLLAIAMVNEVSREFGFKLTLRQIFENPTLGSLARLVANEAAFGNDRERKKPEQAAFIDIATPAALLSAIDQLSDDEIEKALERISALAANES